MSVASDTPLIRPDDEHNRVLIDNVHPPDWTNPTPSGTYDMVVVGAGTAGLITAIGCAGLGKKVALLERHLMGGDCLNVGCVPSKAVIRAARAAAEVRDAAELGTNVSGYSVDFAHLMERMRRLRAGISRHDSARRYTEAGVDVFIGQGVFTGPDRVEVDGQTLLFKKACIATGARASAPPIPGLDEVDYLTNETIFELTELPRRLGVIGAGPIGCELAQSFARFGTEVSLIESTHGILPREDPDAAAIVKQSMVKDGVQLYCCGREVRLERDGDGARFVLASHDKSYDFTVDQVLVAAGRAPNVDGLGLEAAGVDFDRRGVKVNDRLQTSNRNIFAAGDIASRYQFTHAADATSRIVIRNALFPWLPFKGRASKLIMPWCTYTEPEIAHVGRYPKELEEAGVRFSTVEIPLKSIDRAILEGQDEGILKVHVRPGGRILGATLVAAHAGDMISELTTAMVHGVKLHQMSKVIHPYPTQAEAIKRAGDQYFRTWALRLKDRVTRPWTMFTGS